MLSAGPLLAAATHAALPPAPLPPPGVLDAGPRPALGRGLPGVAVLVSVGVAGDGLPVPSQAAATCGPQGSTVRFQLLGEAGRKRPAGVIVVQFLQHDPQPVGQ